MLIPIHAIQKLFSVAEVHASFFLLGNPFIIKPEITFIENYLFSSYLFIKCKQLTYRVEVLRICCFTPRVNRYTETQKSTRIRYSCLGKLLSFSAEFYALLMVRELEEGILKE